MPSHRLLTPLRLLAISGTLVLSAFVGGVSATQPWPAEPWQEALALGDLSEQFSDGDISGAHWNEAQQTLWLTDNKEATIWALRVDNGQFKIHASLDGQGDLEGITQADDDELLYVLDEAGAIRTYHAGSGQALTAWHINAALPDTGKKGKRGPEGITFIPDAWLAKGHFVDAQGTVFSASRHGLGGIFLVAHQNGGGIYAFDLSPSGAFDVIGAYQSARSESSALAFDRDNGQLFISHNTDGNTLEITDLRSVVHDGQRKFVTISEFSAPNRSNLEGFALIPRRNADGSVEMPWLCYTDDDGNSREGNAILVFQSASKAISGE